MEVEKSLLQAMINDTMNAELVEVEILPGRWRWYAKRQDNISRSIHNDGHVVLGIRKSLQLISMIASTLLFDKEQMSLLVGFDFLPFRSCHFLVSDGVICGGASGAGAEASKPGELHMAVVLSKQPSEMSQADILLIRGL